MNKRINQALNEQLNREYSASYLYLAMAAFFEEKGLEGFAKWMEAQSKEEYEHMMKIYRYIFDRGGVVSLKDIKAPKFDKESAVDVVKGALSNEKQVSAWIHDLVELCVSEADHATHNFLQWFVSEQVEEEALFSRITQKLDLVGDNPAALYLLDREVGSMSLHEDED